MTAPALDPLSFEGKSYVILRVDGDRLFDPDKHRMYALSDFVCTFEVSESALRLTRLSISLALRHPADPWPPMLYGHKPLRWKTSSAPGPLAHRAYALYEISPVLVRFTGALIVAESRTTNRLLLRFRQGTFLSKSTDLPPGSPRGPSHDFAFMDEIVARADEADPAPRRAPSPEDEELAALKKEMFGPPKIVPGSHPTLRLEAGVLTVILPSGPAPQPHISFGGVWWDHDEEHVPRACLYQDRHGTLFLERWDEVNCFGPYVNNRGWYSKGDLSEMFYPCRAPDTSSLAVLGSV